MPQPATRARKSFKPTLVESAREMTWEEAVDGFIRDKGGKLSASTQENYRWHLTGPRARVFLDDHDIRTPSQLTGEALNELRMELEAVKEPQPLSSSSIHAFHRVWKNFARWCLRKGYTDDKDILTVEAPENKESERRPHTISKTEERKLLEAARIPRNRMVIEFMMRTGLRLSEVCNVTIDDIKDSPDGAYVEVRQGKGRKDRLVPLDSPGNRLSVKLERYIRNDRPKSDYPELFLINRKDSRGEYGPLTPRGLQILMYRIGQEAGVRANPHSFRHSFATRALTDGDIQPFVLQRALGHTTLAMTNRYVQMTGVDLLKAWKRRKD